jgi:hypothetical protein
MPKWPRKNPADLLRIFGKFELGADGHPTHRWEQMFLTYIGTPWPMVLAWDKSVTVTRIRCHNEVAKSLTKILESLWNLHGKDVSRIQASGLHLYGGCYGYRASRGAEGLSMHAYGAAIDLNPERNALGTKPDKCAMPDEVVDVFKAQGWTWGGDWKARPDPMHFEATN